MILQCKWKFWKKLLDLCHESYKLRKIVASFCTVFGRTALLHLYVYKQSESGNATVQKIKQLRPKIADDHVDE